MSSYFLRSDRLGFRPWRPADIDLAMSLWGDLRVTRLIGGPFTEGQIQERLTTEISTMILSGIQYWPLFRLTDSAHIGCCGLRPYRFEERIFELGCHLRFEHWGHGYASESARAVMHYAFDTLGAAALFAGHNPRNEPSRRLLQRLGFRYTHDEFYSPTGLQHPSYLISREEHT